MKYIYIYREVYIYTYHLEIIHLSYLHSFYHHDDDLSSNFRSTVYCNESMKYMGLTMHMGYYACYV